MVAGVRCWQWISAKAPALELALLTEQQNAWSYTVDAMLGLFSDNHGSSQGIEQVDFVKDDNAPDGKPHAIWLSFLSVSSHCCQHCRADPCCRSDLTCPCNEALSTWAAL